MILKVDVCLEELSLEEKEYKWEKPAVCPGCNSQRFWGHGYRLAHFIEFAAGVWVKRYRCDSCSKVFTTRPSGYLERYQSSTKEIVKALTDKLTDFNWPSSQTRQRAGQWLRRFICFVQSEYGLISDSTPFVERLKNLYALSCPFLSRLS